MKFGIREAMDVTFKAKSDGFLGKMPVVAGQPVLHIDSATTSTLEGQATTVYARGGKGNNRLISWEGDKELTFTVEDALISPIGLSILSGAQLVNPATKSQVVHVHTTSIVEAQVAAGGKVSIDMTDALTTSVDEQGKVANMKELCTTAPIFVMLYENGSITDVVKADAEGWNATFDAENKKATIECTLADTSVSATNMTVFVDYYILEASANVSEIQIDAEHFAGYYYVEGSTLWRDQATGKDYPAEFTLPNVKIQSNFTFSMSSTGDPSTFTFTMDAFPGVTYFEPGRKVLCAIQVVDDAAFSASNITPVFPHGTTTSKDVDADEGKHDGSQLIKDHVVAKKAEEGNSKS